MRDEASSVVNAATCAEPSPPKAAVPIALMLAPKPLTAAVVSAPSCVELSAVTSAVVSAAVSAEVRPDIAVLESALTLAVVSAETFVPSPASCAELSTDTAPALKAETAAVVRSPISALVRPIPCVLVSAAAWPLVSDDASSVVSAAICAELKPPKAAVPMALIVAPRP